MGKDKTQNYLHLRQRLDRADDDLTEYEAILGKESPESLDEAIEVAWNMGDAVNYAMISYVAHGFEAFLGAFHQVEDEDALDVFLASLAKLEQEENFQILLSDYLTCFFDHVMNLFNKAKSTKDYQRLVEDFEIVQEYHTIGLFIYRSILENALINFPNRPALQRVINQALDQVKKDQEPLQELLESAQGGNKDHFYNSISDWLLKGPLYITKQLPKIKGRKNSPLSQVGLLYTKDNEIFIPIFTKKENVLDSFSEEMGYYIEEIDPREFILEYKQKAFIDHPIIINPFTQAILLNDEMYEALLNRLDQGKGKASNIIDIRPYIRK